jgi:hypothetical protein
MQHAGGEGNSVTPAGLGPWLNSSIHTRAPEGRFYADRDMFCCAADAEHIGGS